MLLCYSLFINLLTLLYILLTIINVGKSLLIFALLIFVVIHLSKFGWYL